MAQVNELRREGAILVDRCDELIQSLSARDANEPDVLHRELRDVLDALREFTLGVVFAFRDVKRELDTKE